MNITSPISICSNALLLLGHTPISSFDEAGSGAQVASNLYESSYRNLLSLHRWRFATKTARLSRLTTTPPHSYQYMFQLPSDLIMVINIEGNNQIFEIYGDKLYTNDSDVYLDYIYRVDESFLPPWFTKTMEFFLAMQFAIPVTGNSTRAGEYSGFYEAQLKRAKNIDSSERTNISIISSPFTEVRHG